MSVEEGIPLNRSNDYYRSIFNQVDVDGNGIITRNELKEWLRTNDSHLTDNLLRQIYYESDTNHDGEIDFREFIQMLNNPKYKPIFGQYVNRYIKFVVPKTPRVRRESEDEIDFEQYDAEYTCWPPSLGMIIISIAIICCFVYDETTQENSTLTATGPVATALIFDPHKKEEAWRYLTYLFVHIGSLHLVVNLAVQITIGLPLEMVHGWKRLLPLYFAGVISGSLATAVTDPYTKLAGASGGVYSLLTAHIATIIMNWGEMTLPLVHLLVFTILIVVDFGTAIYNRYTDQLDQSIGYVAHVAGACAGLLVGITILRNIKPTRKENVIWWIAAIVYIVAIICAIILNIFI